LPSNEKNSQLIYGTAGQFWVSNTNFEKGVSDFLLYLTLAWRNCLRQGLKTVTTYAGGLASYLWVFSREDLSDIIYNDSLDIWFPFGIPALIKICEELKIYVPEICYEYVEFLKSIYN
jgi:hypothetical protein